MPRKVAKTPQSAALMLAAVNKRLAELAPGEEPFAAAKRLTAEWDDDHDDLMDVAEATLWILRDGNG